MSQPLIELIIRQMDADPGEFHSQAHNMATVLLTGIERMITVTTEATFPSLMPDDPAPHVRGLLRAQARLLELALVEGRATVRAGS